MNDQPTKSQHAQLQDVARRLLELDTSDPDFRSHVIALKGRATRALNTPVGNRSIHHARAKAIKNRQTTAKKFNASIVPLIQEAKAAGRTGFSDIARYLNDKGVKTSRGSKWLPASVMRVMQELTTNQ